MKTRWPSIFRPVGGIDFLECWSGHTQVNCFLAAKLKSQNWRFGWDMGRHVKRLYATMFMSVHDAKQFKIGQGTFLKINVEIVQQKLFGPLRPGQDPRHRWGHWFSTTFANFVDAEITFCNVAWSHASGLLIFLIGVSTPKRPRKTRGHSWNQRVGRVWSDVACFSQLRHIMVQCVLFFQWTGCLWFSCKCDEYCYKYYCCVRHSCRK